MRRRHSALPVTTATTSRCTARRWPNTTLPSGAVPTGMGRRSQGSRHRLQQHQYRHREQRQSLHPQREPLPAHQEPLRRAAVCASARVADASSATCEHSAHRVIDPTRVPPRGAGSRHGASRVSHIRSPAHRELQETERRVRSVHPRNARCRSLLSPIRLCPLADCRSISSLTFRAPCRGRRSSR
jgi:hypothetical protein